MVFRVVCRGRPLWPPLRRDLLIFDIVIFLTPQLLLAYVAGDHPTLAKSFVDSSLSAVLSRSSDGSGSQCTGVDRRRAALAYSVVPGVVLQDWAFVGKEAGSREKKEN